jgi:signal transduction histidine kinase
MLSEPVNMKKQATSSRASKPSSKKTAQRQWPSVNSMRAQLTGTILLVLGAGLGMLLIIAGAQMSNMTYEAFTSEQQARAYVLAGALTEPLEHTPDQLASTWIDRLRQVAGKDTNISVVDVTGTVLVNSNSTAPASTAVPEMQTALHGQLTSTMRDGRLYVAMPIFHNPQTRLLGVLWLDTTLGPTNDALRDRWIALIVAAFGTLALGALAAWQLETRIVNPLSALREAAGQMANGTLSARVSDKAHLGTADEITALAKAFNHMADQIETTIARQREFVANASHELRAPLAAVKLRAESLASGTLDSAEMQQYAAEIDSETGQLAQLVSHLLQLTRAEDSTFRPPAEPIDPVDVLRDAVRAIRPRIALKQQQLTVDLSADLPDVWLHSDDLRIIVNNLLDNAIKYTPDKGTITLTARFIEAKQQVQIDVRDTGVGIPPGDLPRVTERFFRVDRAHSTDKNSAQPTGTGLGLAITAALVRRYGGTLTLNSSGVPGEGTTARLWLPVKSQ